MVASALPALQSLRTGYTRISVGGIRHLSQAQKLTSLCFHAEDVPDPALASLTGLSNLQVWNCADLCAGRYHTGGLGTQGLFECARAHACECSWLCAGDRQLAPSAKAVFSDNLVLSVLPPH